MRSRGGLLSVDVDQHFAAAGAFATASFRSRADHAGIVMAWLILTTGSVGSSGGWTRHSGRARVGARTRFPATKRSAHAEGTDERRDCRDVGGDRGRAGAGREDDEGKAGRGQRRDQGWRAE